MTISRTALRQPGPPFIDLLVARFAKLAPHTQHERNLLRDVEARPRQTYRAESCVIARQTSVSVPQVILTGWAYAVRELADGRRQVMNILLPGDAIGLCARTHTHAPANVMALSTLRTVEAPEILTAWRDMSRTPNLCMALDLIAAEDEVFMLGQMMRLGRQTAYERVANWLMEVEYRLSSRGLSTNGSFYFPTTQEMIADVVGLSVVHINRTLQQMRREGRIEVARGRLAILDKAGLAQVGEFHPPVLTGAPAAPSTRPEAPPPVILAGA